MVLESVQNSVEKLLRSRVKPMCILHHDEQRNRDRLFPGGIDKRREHRLPLFIRSWLGARPDIASGGFQ